MSLLFSFDWGNWYLTNSISSVGGIGGLLCCDLVGDVGFVGGFSVDCKREYCWASG